MITMLGATVFTYVFLWAWLSAFGPVMWDVRGDLSRLVFFTAKSWFRIQIVER